MSLLAHLLLATLVFDLSTGYYCDPGVCPHPEYVHERSCLRCNNEKEALMRSYKTDEYPLIPKENLLIKRSEEGYVQVGDKCYTDGRTKVWRCFHFCDQLSEKVYIKHDCATGNFNPETDLCEDYPESKGWSDPTFQPSKRFERSFKKVEDDLTEPPPQCPVYKFCHRHVCTDCANSEIKALNFSLHALRHMERIPRTNHVFHINEMVGYEKVDDSCVTDTKVQTFKCTHFCEPVKYCAVEHDALTGHFEPATGIRQCQCEEEYLKCHPYGAGQTENDDAEAE